MSVAASASSGTGIALRAFMAERGLQADGEPIYARCDPPFMPSEPALALAQGSADRMRGQPVRGRDLE
jgi:hypothetical protein